MFKKKFKKFSYLGALALPFIVLGMLLMKISPEQRFELLRSIPLIGWFYAYSFPPADYSLPIVSVPLSELQNGNSIRRSLILKYSGRYVVRINGFDSSSPQQYDLGLKIVFFHKDGQCILAREINHSVIRSGVDGDILNYHYLYFNVPEDLPLKNGLIVEASTYGNSQELLFYRPSARLEVVKMFDK